MITFLSICVVHGFESFWVNFGVNRIIFYWSWFSEKKRSTFALFNIDCKFFCSALEPSTISWKAIPRLVFIILSPLSQSISRSELPYQKTVRTLKENKIRKPKIINARTWFMKMMSFFPSIPLYVCNFRNCFIRHNLGEVEIHIKLWWFLFPGRLILNIVTFVLSRTGWIGSTLEFDRNCSATSACAVSISNTFSYETECPNLDKITIGRFCPVILYIPSPRAHPGKTSIGYVVDNIISNRSYYTTFSTSNRMMTIVNQQFAQKGC